MDLNAQKKPSDFEIQINKINSFKYDGQKKRVDLSQTMDQEFHNSENNLEFFFSVPNFSSVTATKYQYQLEGINKKWSLPSKSSSVLFENIPYGNFTFKVRGIVSGNLSGNVASYQFEIQRPWYFSNVFISFYVFAFFTVSLLFPFGFQKIL